MSIDRLNVPIPIRVPARVLSAPLAVALLACTGGEEPAPAEQATETTTSTAALTDPQSCGPQSATWPAPDPSAPDWRSRIPDAPTVSNGVPVQERVGRIDGKASVSVGLGGYAIPLFAPPGRADMAPQLSLRYSSGSAGDLAGVGWTVTGVSRIHRCGRTHEQDGEARPVNLTPTDRLCLDGERLVVVAGTYGAANAEYRTERDTFSRITQLGPMDSAATCFRLEEKGGHTIVYGGCSDPGAAHVLPGASAVPWAWAQSVVSDRLGNEIRFEYAVEDGQHLMRRARYTGFKGAAGDRSIELSYEPREDVDVLYIAQRPLRSVRRLRAVTSYVGTAVVRRYQLGYSVSVATRRSLLERVTECSGASCDATNSLPPTVFTYQQQPIAFTTVPTPLPDPARDRVRMIADLDGDGTRDRELFIGGERRVELSTGSTAPTPTDSRPEGTDQIDFDVDGQSDLPSVMNGKFGVVSWSAAEQRFVTKLTSALPISARWTVADFNNDGRNDVLALENHPVLPPNSNFEYTLHLQCPTSPAGTVQFCDTIILPTPQPESQLLCERIVKITDLDGNGYPDVLFDDDPWITPAYGGVCAGAAHVLFTRKVTPTTLAFSDAELGTLGCSGCAPVDVGARMTDINGDGLLDVVNLRSTPSSPNGRAFINEGGNQQGVSTKFRAETIQLPPGGASIAVKERLLGAVLEADVDNDGHGELLVPAQITTEWCYLYDVGQAEPTEYCSFSSPTWDASAAPRDLDRTIYRFDAVDLEVTSTGQVMAMLRNTNLELPLQSGATAVDAFGDGLSDIQFRINIIHGLGPAGPTISGHYRNGPPEGARLARNNGPAPDLLISASDGLGAVARYAYAPLSSTGDARCVSAVDQPFYRANPGNFSPGNPYHLFTSSMQVVSRLETSDGIGGVRGTCYRYRDAWIHGLGRGFMGFGEITEEDDVPGDAANDLRRTSTYRHDFPYQGRMTDQTEMLASDPLGAFPLKKVHTVWLASCQGTLPGNRRCFVFRDSELEQHRDLATRNTWFTINTDDIYNATDLANGNLTERVVQTSDTVQWQNVRTQLAYDYTDAAAWWLDKLSQKTETYETIHAFTGIASPGPVSHQRITRSTYAPTTRLLQSETLQPGHPDQETSTSYTHDAYGNRLSTTQTAARAVPRTTLMTYGADGYFMTSVKNPAKHLTRTVTDAALGLPTQTTDPNGLVTTMAYDAFGRRTLEARPGQPPTAERLRSCTAATCPPLAVLRHVTQQMGAPTVTRYLDRLQRPIRVATTAFDPDQSSFVLTQYDARGRKVATSQPTFDPNVAYFTRMMGHDPLGRPTLIRIERSATASIDFGLRYSGVDTYLRRPGTATEIRKTSDSRGRLWRVVDPLGGATDYRYAPSGQLALIQDSQGNRTTMTFDDLGRQVAVSHPDRGTATTVFDGFGQIVSQTDARGVVVAHTYDGLGRRLTRDVNGKRVAQWGYDAVTLGVVDYERGGSEGLASYCRGYDHDSFGRVLEQITFAEGQVLSVQNAWDGRYGRLKGTRFPSAREVAFDFTAGGYPLAERDPKSTVPYRRITAMSADGKITGEQFGNGLTGSYSYDPSSGQPTQLWVRPPGLTAPPVQHLSYFYNDPLGRLSGHGSTVSVGAGTVTESFSYDAVSRLIRSNRSWGFGVLPPQIVDYQYDALGNLTVKSDYSATTRYGTSARTNPANAGPHAIQSAQLVGGALVSDFLYDANGNLLRGDGRVAVYDAFDKPTQVTEAGKTVRFAYGPNGELYRRTTASDRTYHVDQLHERVLAFGSTSVVERDYVAGKIVLNRDSTGAQFHRYLHLDRLASVDTVTDDQGAVIRRQGFDPFGGPRSGAWLAVSTLSNPATDRGFTGHEQVDDVHAIHMAGRMYDYRLGRFMSVDPFIVDPTDAQSLNAYSYARNNPIGRIDPSGYKDLAPYEPGTHFLDDLTDSLNKFGDDVRGTFKSATKKLADLGKGSASVTPGNAPKGTREHEKSDAPEDTLGTTKISADHVSIDLKDTETVTIGPVTFNRTLFSLDAFGYHFRIIELESGGHDVELTRDLPLGAADGEAGGSLRVDSESTEHHRIGDASVVERTSIPVGGNSVPVTDTKHPVGSLGFGVGASRAMDQHQQQLDEVAGGAKEANYWNQCAEGCPP